MPGMSTSKSFRPRRDFAGLKQRRLRAAQMFQAGQTQAEVARVLGVSRQSASRWEEQFRAGGVARLHGAGRAGRKPKLAAGQLAAVATALRQGPQAHGFATNLWTLPRVAQVVAQITGAKYHPGHVWRLMPQLGWSLQRPARRARERNPAAVQRWVDRRWPALKKKPAASAAGSSS
jgi:transposase